MGRIAEALKRAEQERARHLDQGPGQDPSDCAQPESLSEDCATALLDGDAAADDSPEPVHRPFVVHAQPIVPEAVDRRVVAFHNPSCTIAERYRSVRTRLLTANPGGSPRLHAVTSSMPREGKTVTTANLAYCMAELRHLRVALVDLDLRQRGLSRLFGVAGQPGMAEVLRGERTLADVCIPAVRANLHLIPAGDLGGQCPSELLTGERVRSVFREISARFHYGLVDTPAANTVADLGLIAPLCHSVVLVIRMNRTPEPLVRRCVKMLQANGTAIVGSILAGYSEETLASSDAPEFGLGPHQEGRK